MKAASRGLTYLEMLLVLALMSLLALGALPMLHHHYRHMKEIELRRTLNEMRAAIDRYHEYAILGQIEPWDLEWNMYPRDLDMLIDGVEVREALDQPPLKIKFLRKIPVDPMTGEADWNCRGYDDDPDEWSSSCDDVYDVASQSPDQALDGSYYRDW